MYSPLHSAHIFLFINIFLKRLRRQIRHAVSCPLIYTKRFVKPIREHMVASSNTCYVTIHKCSRKYIKQSSYVFDNEYRFSILHVFCRTFKRVQCCKYLQRQCHSSLPYSVKYKRTHKHTSIRQIYKKYLSISEVSFRDIWQRKMHSANI